MDLSFKFNNKLNNNERLESINQRLPENEIICKEILNKYNNKDTKVIKDENIKGSYYVYINDTIYLANNEKVKNAIYRVVLIAHECRHSLQSKFLQKLNFIFSNIELLAFCILFIFGVIKFLNIYTIAMYLLIMLLSIVFRFILEYDAVKCSFKMAKDYISEKTKKDEGSVINNLYSYKVKLLFPIMILQLFCGRILRFFIILFMYKYIN